MCSNLSSLAARFVKKVYLPLSFKYMFTLKLKKFYRSKKIILCKKIVYSTVLKKIFTSFKLVVFLNKLILKSKFLQRATLSVNVI